MPPRTCRGGSPPEFRQDECWNPRCGQPATRGAARRSIRRVEPLVYGDRQVTTPRVYCLPRATLLFPLGASARRDGRRRARPGCRGRSSWNSQGDSAYLPRGQAQLIDAHGGFVLRLEPMEMRGAEQHPVGLSAHPVRAAGGRWHRDLPVEVQVLSVAREQGGSLPTGPLSLEPPHV